MDRESLLSTCITAPNPVNLGESTPYAKDAFRNGYADLRAMTLSGWPAPVIGPSER